MLTYLCVAEIGPTPFPRRSSGGAGYHLSTTGSRRPEIGLRRRCRDTDKAHAWHTAEIMYVIATPCHVRSRYPRAANHGLTGHSSFFSDEFLLQNPDLLDVLL